MMKRGIPFSVSSLVIIAIALGLASCNSATPMATETDASVIQEPTMPIEVPTDTPEAAHPLAGLVFSNYEGTWWINRQGQLEMLIDRASALLSPDEDLIVYIEEDPTTYMGDLWVLERATGERRNITQTPDRDEAAPSWLSGEPDMLVFGSGTETGMGNQMFPTVVKIDGSGYRILDSETGGYVGVSPDGKSIVYGGYQGTAFIMSLDSEPAVFDPAAFGVDIEKLFLPAWSPDGDRIAWFVAADFENSGVSQLAIVVFDLRSKSAISMHHYSPIGGSMFANDLVWSPDGAWLAFTTIGEAPASGRAPNLWVIRPDGSDEAYIAEGSTPVWRYDSQLLAFQGLNESQTEEVFLADAGTWEVTRIDDIPLPERIGFLLDWVVP